VRRVPPGARKVAGTAFKIGKNSVATLVMKPRQRVGKMGLIVHALSSQSSREAFLGKVLYPATLS
jgi:hypothetical protein